MPKLNKNAIKKKKGKGGGGGGGKSDYQKNQIAQIPTRRVTPKQGPAPNNPKSKRGGGGMRHHPLAKQVCAVTNPFCDEAIGARYADAAATRSLPYTVRGSIGVDTGTAGDGVTYIRAQADGIYYANCSGTTTSNQTLGSSWLKLAGPPSQMDEARLTCWGIKCSVVSPVATSCGVMRILTMSEAPAVTSVNSINDYTQSVVETMSCTPGTNAHWIAKPTNPVQARMFKPTPTTVVGPPEYAPAKNVMQSEQSGWQTVGVACIDATVSTTPVWIDVVAHYEFTLGNGSSLMPYAHPTPTPNPATARAADAVFAKAPQTHWNKTTENVDSWFAQATSAVLAAIAPIAKDAMAGMASDALGALPMLFL